MPIRAAIGVQLVKDYSDRLIARKAADGIGWHCIDCGYQSKGVWPDPSEASRSLAFHVEHVCWRRKQ
jgi:hypothetical protein